MKNSINILGAGAMMFALSMPVNANAGDYPVAVNSRPQTLPGGAWAAQASFLAGGDFEIMALGLGGSYAINDELELGLGGIGMIITPEFAVSESLDLGVAYSVHRDGPLDIAATLGLPLSFEEGADPVSSIGLGAMTRYNLMDGNLSIHTGDDLIGINFGGDDLVAMLHLPVGFAYQVNENINIRLDTMLAMIPLTGGDLVSIADVTPVNLMFGYSVDNKMDVGLMVAGDLQNFGDTLNLAVGVAYRGL